MPYKYYRGERNNPFEAPNAKRNNDVRSLYWMREQFVSGFDDATEGIKEYPCASWPDFIRRANAKLSERGLAFEIDFQNSKHHCGEYNEDWHSYFAGPRVLWQKIPFKMPKKTIAQTRFTFTDCRDIGGCTIGKLVVFGPIVSATYRGIAEAHYGQQVPIFDIVNLRGDKLYVNTPVFSFRSGKFTVAGQYKDDKDNFHDVYVYDKRLHVALAKLVLDSSSPAICVDEHLDLPTLNEAENDYTWYRLFNEVSVPDK